MFKTMDNMQFRRVTIGLSENAKQFILKYLLQKKTKENIEKLKK